MLTWVLLRTPWWTEDSRNPIEANPIEANPIKDVPDAHMRG